jgi:dipeptidyl aminopeptidase/acylaminoacyl peptidase
MTTIAPYGSWVSPIDAAQTMSTLIGFSEVRLDDTDLYWLEARPAEGGRQVLVRRSGSGATADVVPADTNVRTMVHEYGGGAFTVAGGTVVYSDFADQRLYRIDAGDDPTPITPEPPRPRSIRYADGVIAGDVVVCVRERHPDDGEALNELVAVPIDGSGDPLLLVGGPDFVSSPRVSPDGRRIAWLSWDHPNMPWDGTELWVASFDGTSVGEPDRVAGSAAVSVVQPEWGPDGALYFSADPTGWWNLYRHDADGAQPLLEVEAEAGFPQWVFGLSCYGFLSGGRIAVASYQDGRHRLSILGEDGATPLDLDYSLYRSVVTDGAGRVFFVGYHPTRPSRIVEFDVDHGVESTVVANPDLVEPTFVPEPQILSYPTADGETAHAIYYPPTNPDFEAPEGELPPLRVEIHGGPTSNAYPVLSLGFAYWTSRGFGVVDVNYGGSTGYGRAYRDRLKGRWGIVDVQDAVGAARYLADSGLADPDRLVITGGSAGGFTTLAALAFHDTFAAGSSYYGVADLELLDADTHKFESRYVGSLVGPSEVQRERSPIHHLDGFDRPVILFQGLEDVVVPPDQARAIAAALDAKGVTHSLVLYEGEQHGFRDAKTIVHALESELTFLGHVLGFEPAGELATVDIKHAGSAAG